MTDEHRMWRPPSWVTHPDSSTNNSAGEAFSQQPHTLPSPKPASLELGGSCLRLRDSAIFAGVPDPRPLYDLGQLKKKRKYKPRVRKHPVPFLSRLVQMFEKEPEYIEWRDGDIVIQDPKKLEAKLPTYFRHGNYNSFLRQLNNFGFNKVDVPNAPYTLYVKVQGEKVKDIAGLLALRPRERKSEPRSTTPAFELSQHMPNQHPFFSPHPLTQTAYGQDMIKDALRRGHMQSPWLPALTEDMLHQHGERIIASSDSAHIRSWLPQRVQDPRHSLQPPPPPPMVPRHNALMMHPQQHLYQHDQQHQLPQLQLHHQPLRHPAQLLNQHTQGGPQPNLRSASTDIFPSPQSNASASEKLDPAALAGHDAPAMTEPQALSVSPANLAPSPSRGSPTHFKKTEMSDIEALLSLSHREQAQDTVADDEADDAKSEYRRHPVPGDKPDVPASPEALSDRDALQPPQKHPQPSSALYQPALQAHGLRVNVKSAWRDDSLSFPPTIPLDIPSAAAGMTQQIIPTARQFTPESMLQLESENRTLRSRVQVLEHEKTRARAESEEMYCKLQELRSCLVCFDTPRFCMFSTCGHFMLCVSCAKERAAERSKPLTCPRCSQPLDDMPATTDD